MTELKELNIGPEELKKLREMKIVDEIALRDVIIREKYIKLTEGLPRKSKKKTEIKIKIGLDFNLGIKAIEDILTRKQRRKKPVEIKEEDVEGLFG